MWYFERATIQNRLDMNDVPNNRVEITLWCMHNHSTSSGKGHALTWMITIVL